MKQADVGGLQGGSRDPALPRGTRGAPDRPSIAVLPLVDRGGEGVDAYLGDGLADDIATELSRYRSLVVIGTVSAFSARALADEPRAVYRRLGAQYVVTGGLRREGEALGVNVQLVDALSEQVVWADRFQGRRSELLDVQNEIVRTIVARVEGSLANRETTLLAELPPRNWRAYDFVLRGRHALYRYDTRAAAECFEAALVVDPRTADAHAYLAMGLVASAWTDGDGAALDRARDHAREAVACDGDSPMAHAALAYVRQYGGELEAAGPHYERALALNANDPKLLAYAGAWRTYMGEPELGLALSDRALARDPQPSPGVWSIRSNALFQLGRDADTIGCIDRIAEPSWWDWPYLVGSLARLGDEASLARLRLAHRPALLEDFDRLARHAAQEPYRLPAHRRRLLDGLRAAREIVAPVATAPAAGAPLVTDRERECLLWAARGKTAWEIGAILSISERTARTHLGAAMRKLDVRTRAQAVARAIGTRLIRP